jgi:hypothetical protein
MLYPATRWEQKEVQYTTVFVCRKLHLWEFFLFDAGILIILLNIVVLLPVPVIYSSSKEYIRLSRLAACRRDGG